MVLHLGIMDAIITSNMDQGRITQDHRITPIDSSMHVLQGLNNSITHPDKVTKEIKTKQDERIRENILMTTERVIQVTQRKSVKGLDIVHIEDPIQDLLINPNNNNNKLNNEITLPRPAKWGQVTWSSIHCIVAIQVNSKSIPWMLQIILQYNVAAKI